MSIAWRVSVRRVGLLATYLFVVGIFTLVMGCTRGQKLQPLTPAFSTGTGTGTHEPGQPVERISGASQPDPLYDNVQVSLLPTNKPGSGQPVQGLSKTVQENVTAPGSHAAEHASSASTRPSTTQATSQASRTATTGVSSGQYVILGGVVAEVNSTPIYADKVLALVEPVLAARAKEVDATQFRTVATKEITLQMVALRNLELEYAAAERNLDRKDKDLADNLTMQWKLRQITAAGGSQEMARLEAAQRGEDFDDLVRQQYRLIMSRIYYEKKVIPRIQVSAADMRQYYDRNRDRDFTDHGTAKFRLIKIDVRKAGGLDQAMHLAEELRNRIVKAGEPFDAIARSVNDDPRLLKTGGDLGAAIQEGAFAVEPVEKAVWATPDGQVTPIIETPNALYLAKVEEKKPGHILPFDDEEVQAKITEILRSQQFRAMRQEVQENLVKDAVIRSDASMMNIAVDMAMQNYPRWSGKTNGG